MNANQIFNKVENNPGAITVEKADDLMSEIKRNCSMDETLEIGDVAEGALAYLISEYCGEMGW